MAKYKVKKATADQAAALGVSEGTPIVIKTKKKKKNRALFGIKPKRLGKAVSRAAKVVRF